MQPNVPRIGGAAHDRPLLIQDQRCCRACYDSGAAVPNDPKRPNSPYCAVHRRERSTASQAAWRQRKRAQAVTLGALRASGSVPELTDLLQTVAGDLDEIAEAVTTEVTSKSEGPSQSRLYMTRRAMTELPALAARLRTAVADLAALPC